MHNKSILHALALALVAAATLLHAADAPAPLQSGIDLASLDAASSPGADFFQYANGKWNKANPIPAEHSSWGSFSKLHDDNVLALHKIMDSLLENKESLEPDSRKLRDFYLTALDQAAIDKLGATPLAGELDKIAAIKSRDDLIAQLAHMQTLGIETILGFSVGQDEKQSDRYIVHLWQGGTNLPEREYYLGDTDDSKSIRKEYLAHITKILTLLGDTEEAAAKNAQTIMSLETRLAEASRTPVQLRDDEANYHKQALAELQALTPNLNWKLYLKSLDVPEFPNLIVGQPEFLQRINELLNSVPLADWQTVLRFRLADSMARFLSTPFEEEDFRFYVTVLRGSSEMQPRWKRALGMLDDQMGEALGRLYVQKHFPPEAAKRMDALVKNVLAAYAQRLASRDWMSDATKKQSLAKLAAITTKIGFPKKWRDYSTLNINTDSYVQNILRAQAFETRFRLNRIGKPVDRDEWQMTPPTVNAYYNASQNEIVFPAGILQPPFFNFSADDAINYGAIGAIIAHEITHGFDDQGSKYDARGNLGDWWTADDRRRFNEKTARLVKQFNECIAIESLHVNGELTLGENIADLGGITIAYDAYVRSLAGKQAAIIDGLTGPQRFFLGFATNSHSAIRDESQRLQLRTDPHSPERFRTNVPLSNFQPFYDAFNIKPADPIYRRPEDRVEVW